MHSTMIGRGSRVLTLQKKYCRAFNWPNETSAPKQCLDFRVILRPNSSVPNFSRPGILSNYWRRIFPKVQPTPKTETSAVIEELYLTVGVPRLLEICCNEVDYLGFIERFKMPDTFNSWCKISLLHIWILFTRVCHEDEQFYQCFKEDMMEFFWTDVRKRLVEIKRFRAASGVDGKTIHTFISNAHHMSVIFYTELDEALLYNDTAMAGCLWRIFYDSAENYDLVAMNNLVKYIRFHVHKLQSVQLENLVNKPFKWKFV